MSALDWMAYAGAGLHARVCSVEGCGRGGRLARGMCAKDYRRWLYNTPPDQRSAPPRFADDETTKLLYRPPGTLTTDEAAELAGVTWDTVTRWWSGGLLPLAATLNGHRAFRREDIERLSRERGGKRLPRRLRGLDLTGADERLRRRFWSKVDTLGDCWTWQRHCNNHGYGQFAIRDGDPRLAHVVSYALERDPVPAGLCVCHHCDNPPCVRPDHLFLGTAKDNSDDKIRKGRQGRPSQDANEGGTG